MALNLALNKDEERKFINVLKGIAIFFVIVGHTVQHFSLGSSVDFYENPIFKVIYTFHMPLFMLISGYLFFYSFKKRDLKELIKHRTFPLISTIAVFGILKYYLTTGVESVLNRNFSALLNGECLKGLYEFWFLWSVIASSLIVSVVFKKINNKLLQLLCLVPLSGLIVFFPSYTLTLFVFPYFVIGFCFSLYREKIPAFLMKLKYASLVIFPVMLMFYEKKHYIYTSGLIGSQYSIKEYIFIDAFRWAIGLVGSLFIITVVFLIFKIKPLEKLFTALSKLGGYTLQIYVYQTIILSGMVDIMLPRLFKAFGIHNFLPENAVLYNAVIVPILSVISTIFFYFMSKWLNKFKIIQTIFGR